MASPKTIPRRPKPGMIFPAHGDPIRIVPLYLPETVTAEAAAPAVAPQLSYRGGPLLTAVEVVTVFWGNAWGAAQSAMAKQLNQFFDFILTSALIDQLGEYNVPGQLIGHGRHIGSVTVTTPNPPRTVSDNAMQHMLQQEISTNSAFPQPSMNVLYFVYLPPGVSLVQGGGRSCQAFCGYHNDINGTIFYAAMPYPGCTGCLGALQPIDALTSTSSHELCESITDAIPGQGWYDDTNGEIGDICAWKTKKIGNYTVQLEWSNKNDRCM